METPNSRSEPKESLATATDKSSPPKDIEQGEEEVVSDLEKIPKDDDDEGDEDDSSNDDSSYFRNPENLPSPGSGTRRFSYSSSIARKESDASLSLSDDSEEHTQQIAQRPPQGVADLSNSHRITRMHSVNSLASTSSPEQDLDMYLEEQAQFSHENTQPLYNGNSYVRSAPPQQPQMSEESMSGSLLQQPKEDFKVYWQRWIMLAYMSILNLLSDWTCYSVAPIALLTEEAFGNINPEQLVVIFLGANAIATACEPIILSRLGLRRTVIFGALLLMMGSVIKSGGMPPIIAANLQKGQGEWRVYLGFFLVGLSQPLYQCTPALLSASWFPEHERTMATGVALNANQLGIGFAFVFGTLLVAKEEDIPPYFGLLSIISTLTFLGCLMQFDDAPPTPPSDTARVMRGDLEIRLPSPIQSLIENVNRSVRSLGNKSGGDNASDDPNLTRRNGFVEKRSRSRGKEARRRKSGSRRSRSGSGEGVVGRSRSGEGVVSRRSPNAPSSRKGTSDGAAFHGLAAPPVAMIETPGDFGNIFPSPSPMMPGPVGQVAEAEPVPCENDTMEAHQAQDPSYASNPRAAYHPSQVPVPYGYPGNMPYPPPTQHQADQTASPYPMYPVQYPYPGYPYYVDPQYTQYFAEASGAGHGTPWDEQQGYAVGYYGASPGYPVANPYYGYYPPHAYFPLERRYDPGAEPMLRMTDHHLDIDIRDDQVLLSIRSCLKRSGFVHALVSFTVSGIVINTLSTFMDYLVRLNGAGREMTGIVGGSFQFVIMGSSLAIGRLTDKTRAYYSVTMAMLVLGAFGLAQCGVSLDADRGNDLRWSLLVVAVLVGPLQPVSTELGVDVVYPLSENTVLVIQQLFSNLLSAIFIPCFKALKDIGRELADTDFEQEKPEYTFSFYLLIILHATATVFFATFNGRYLRYEHELQKKADEERRNASLSSMSWGPHEYDETTPFATANNSDR